MKIIIASLAFISFLSFSQTPIAVIDSGVDYKHESLAEHMWQNPLEIPGNNRDEDGNGYEDDVFGWNFAEDNSMIIDYKYLNTFSQDPYTFFEIQGKSFQDLATEEEKNWVREKTQDPVFVKEMQIFGNFVHGTHVAGIASGGDPEVQIMGIKLLPTEVKLPFSLVKRAQKKEPINNGGKSKSKSPRKPHDRLMRMGIKYLASTQAKSMINIASYIHGHKIPIANGSFGTGFPQAKGIVKMLAKILSLGGKVEEKVIEDYAKLALEEMAKSGRDFVKEAPSTLFVFAAGNDGLNNDIYGTSPANIRADNVITVAATFHNKSLAPFSNYGLKVHVAAPGVIIPSAIPGDEYLKVSGTSQAAPYVANIAALVKNINPKLQPKEIKKILMGTVEKVDYLKGKVESGGYIHKERALEAAELSLTMSLDKALAFANKMDFLIKTELASESQEVDSQIIGPIMPLTAQFK